jgi:hypothetical protein
LAINNGGTTFDLTGTLTANSQMSGSYEAPGGSCSEYPMSGIWTAFLVPPISANFTGTLSNSAYMAALNGGSTPAPITVTGTLTQGPSNGSNSAIVTGTITAQNYPCFVTASLTGTISGNTVLLSVYGYNGDLIGSIGDTAKGTALAVQLPAASTAGTVLETGQGGLLLGGSNSGPCPVIQTDTGADSADSAEVQLTLQ